MRIVAGMLALTLSAPMVRAQGQGSSAPAAPRESPRASAEATRGRFPLRVVRVMPESRQALLFDRVRSTHVLAEVGGKVDGYSVESIEGDEVTLSSEGKQIVLVGPARGSRRQDRDAGVASSGAPAQAGSAAREFDETDGDAVRSAVRSAEAPVDPYAGQERAGASHGGPVDPYSERPIRVVQAPGSAQRVTGTPERQIEPGDDGVRVVSAPSTAVPLSSRVIEPGSDGVRVVSAHGATGASAPAAATATPINPYAEHEVDAGTAGAAPTMAAAPTTDTAAASASPASSSVPSMAATSAGSAMSAVPAASMAATSAGSAASAVPATSMAATSGDSQASGMPAASIVTATSAGTGATGASTGAAAASSLTSGTVAARVSGGRTGGSGDRAVLTRTEVDASLADFARLTQAVRGRFTPEGVVIEGVEDGSLFQRAGLRTGDVVVAVDGTRLRSLDDAASVYARAGSAREVNVQIVRSGKPATIHVMIQ